MACLRTIGAVNAIEDLVGRNNRSLLLTARASYMLLTTHNQSIVHPMSSSYLYTSCIQTTLIFEKALTMSEYSRCCSMPMGKKGRSPFTSARFPHDVMHPLTPSHRRGILFKPCAPSLH